MEAITSRPLLLAAVGKAASHAGQTTLYLTPLHGKAGALKTLIANVRAAFRHVALLRSSSRPRPLGHAAALRQRQDRARAAAVQAA